MFGAGAGEFALDVAEQRVRRDDVDDIRFLNGVSRLDVVLQNVVDCAVFAGIGAHAERKVALRVKIDAEDPVALVLEAGADRVCGCGLADAAFLVDERNHLSHGYITPYSIIYITNRRIRE